MDERLPIEPARRVTASIGQPTAVKGEGTSLIDVLTILLREMRLIAAFVAVGIVISLAVALLRAPTYTTDFSLVPQEAPDPSRSGLASLAGQFGVNLGGSAGLGDSPEIYADLMKTRAILQPIILDTFVVSHLGTRLTLAEFFEISGETDGIVFARTLLHLRKKVIFTEVATRTTGVVTVEVRTTSPQVSHAIATRLLQGVTDFNLETRQSQAGAERRFAEARLAEAQAELRRAEDASQRFLLANRQVNGSPALSFQRERLQREVTRHEQVVAGLAQSFEDARLREVRDTPVVTVIDQPMIAAQPDPRGRLKLLIAGTFAAAFLGFAAALLRDGTRRLRARGELAGFAEEWRRIRRART